MSEVKIFLADKLATYVVGESFGAEGVSEYTLEGTAAHELLHVLLAELIEVASTQGHTTEQLRGAEHRIINTLLTLLVPKP